MWSLENSLSLQYFDPNIGCHKGDENSPVIDGYRIPVILTHTGKSKPNIFVGDRRCAFYFNAPLDDRGMLLPVALDTISTNINEDCA